MAQLIAVYFLPIFCVSFLGLFLTLKLFKIGSIKFRILVLLWLSFAIIPFFIFYFILDRFYRCGLWKALKVWITAFILNAVIIFMVAFFIRYFLFQPFVVDGESMSPNYNNNEYVIAKKYDNIINRGDVVIFRYPGNPSVSYIKRVIGLPGEKVIIENNMVRIINAEYPDGTVLKENYLISGVLTLPKDSKIQETTLDDGEYFVMGDNRQQSSDSREWGKLPEQNIIGKIMKKK